MQDFEKLGAFYLGRPFDLQQKKPKEGLLLYNVKLLTLVWAPYRNDPQGPKPAWE